jgi:integrase/recombinase XerD
MPGRPKQQEHDKVITPEEKSRLLEHIDSPEQEFTRAAAVIRTVLKTGLRCSEVAHLKVDHCHLHTERPWVDVFGGKMRESDHADSVPIATKFAAYLAEYIERAGSREFVFEGKGHGLTRNTIWADVKDVFRRLRFNRKYAVHALRHRYVTDVYKAYKDPMTTMNMARHKNLAVTTRYIHTAGEESAEFREKLDRV